MSSSPAETETHDVELSREERWIVHHVLTRRADDAIDDRRTPPDWLLATVETLESGGSRLTGVQARKLHDLVSEYASDDAPERDVDPAIAVANRLEQTL